MTLRELYEEKLRRLHGELGIDDKPAPTPAKRRRDPGPPSATSESPAEAWLAERSVARANPDDLSPGEIVNVLEGLTPSGKDRSGRKVSFVERGTDVYGNTGRVSHLSSRPKRIS